MGVSINIIIYFNIKIMTLNHRAPGSSPGGDTAKRVGRCPALFFAYGLISLCVYELIG